MAVPEGLPLQPANERREAIHDIGAFLHERQIDIALLQEVRNDAPGARPGGVPRQFELLREAAGATDAAYGIAMASGAGDEYGICILTRNGTRLRRHQVAFLPYAGGRERRIVLFAQAELDGAALTVANVHLDHTGMDRRGQLAELERILRGLADGEARIADAAHDYRLVDGYDGPLVAGGDFNDAAEAVAAGLAGIEMVNVIDSLDADDPLRGDTHVRAGRIDHLLLSTGLELVEQELCEVPPRKLREGTGVTDHLAVVATVLLPGTGDPAR